MKNLLNIVSDNRPWPGLASYSVDDSRYFLGRTKEIVELIERILAEPLNCLYGPSGIGKSSLLQAGIGNSIKEYGYFPVFIRLNYHADLIDYIKQIIETVKETSKKEEIEIAEIEQAIFNNQNESLWEFFHRNIFWNKRNYQVKPLLIFDQFEELFTLSYLDKNTKDFIKELGELAENTVPEGIQKHLRESNIRLTIPTYTQDYSILLSLREDFLAQLEMLTHNIPAFRRNRFAIKALNGEQALEIINVPGKDIIDEFVAEEIVNIISTEKNKIGDIIPLNQRIIEPALLSLFCSELNEKRISENKEKITLEQVKSYGGNIIQNFYFNCFSSVSVNTAEFIEDNLLTESGYRNPVALENFIAAKIDKEEIDKLINQRLLRKEERQGVLWVEFSHDILTKVALTNRNNRRIEKELVNEKKHTEELALEQSKQKIKYRKLKLFTGIISLMFIVLGYCVIYMFFMIHVDYYATVVKRNGFIEGRRQLTLEEASHKSVYYKLSKRGLYTISNGHLSKKPYNRMSALNGYNKLTTLHNMGTYLTDHYNDENSIGVEDKIKVKLKSVCQWEFISTDKGHIASERGYDEKNQLIFSYNYTRIDTGNAKPFVCQYLDKYGLPLQYLGEDKAQRKIRAGFIRVNYDENGYEYLREFYDFEGNPTPNRWGTYGTMRKYNKMGLLTEEASMDEFGDVNQDSEEIAGQKIEYDSNCNPIMFISINKKNEICTTKSGYSIIKKTYDQYGNELSIRYYDKNKKPCLNSDGYHGIFYQYNEHGNIKEQKYVGLDGTTLSACAKNNPIALYKVEYDQKGNKILQQSFNKWGKQDGINDWVKVEHSYNDNSIIISERDFSFKSGSLQLGYEYRSWKDASNRDTLSNTYISPSNIPSKQYSNNINPYLVDIKQYSNDSVYKIIRKCDKNGNENYLAYYRKSNKPSESTFDCYYIAKTVIIPGDTITINTQYYNGNDKLSDCYAFSKRKFHNGKLIKKTYSNKQNTFIWEYDIYSRVLSEYNLGISKIPYRPYDYYKIKKAFSLQHEYNRLPNNYKNMQNNYKNIFYSIQNDCIEIEGFNELNEPSIIDEHGRVYSKKDNNNVYYDLNGNKMKTVKDFNNFKKTLHSVAQIRLLKKIIGVQDGDILITCNDWKYKPDEDSSLLASELRKLRNHEKTLSVVRFFPKERKFKLLHFTFSNEQAGIDLTTIYFTPNEFKRLMSVVQKN